MAARRLLAGLILGSPRGPRAARRALASAPGLAESRVECTAAALPVAIRARRNWPPTSNGPRGTSHSGRVPNRSLAERWGGAEVAGGGTHFAICPAFRFGGGHQRGVRASASHAKRQARGGPRPHMRERHHLQERRYAESLVALRGGEALPATPRLRARARSLHGVAEGRRRGPERGQRPRRNCTRCATRSRTAYADDGSHPPTRGEAEGPVPRTVGPAAQVANGLRAADRELDRRWRADLLDRGHLTAHLHRGARGPGP